MQFNVLNKFAATWLAGVALLVGAQAALAADTPATLAGATVVTADKAKELQAKGAVVVDARVANEYADAHIKGAINIPYKEKSAKSVDYDPSQDSWDASKLPADKNANIVIYCNAGECWKSYKAAHMAIKDGYKHIYWFRGGFPEWKAKGYPIE